MSDATAHTSSPQESPDYDAPIGNSPFQRLDAKNRRQGREAASANVVSATDLQKLIETARGLTKAGYIPTSGYGAMDIMAAVWERSDVASDTDCWDLVPDQIGEIMDAYREGNSHG
jgi:hypothetical protein